MKEKKSVWQQISWRVSTKNSNKTGQNVLTKGSFTLRMDIFRVNQNHIFIRMHGVYTVFLAGKSPNIRCRYTVLAKPTYFPSPQLDALLP
jgi:hypothetical protein